MSNKRFRVAWWSEISRPMYFAVLGALFVTLFSHTPVLAAGESYAWASSDTITVRGGSLSKNATLYASGSSASGVYTLSDNGSVHCNAKVSLTLSSDRKTATYTFAGVNVETSSPGGPTNSCSSSQQSTIAAYQGKSVGIGGSQGGGADETAAQRRIKFSIVNNGSKNSAPNKVRVTLRDGSNKLIKEQSVSIDNDGWYYGAFNDVSPGTYKACVDKTGSIAAACDSVTKVKFEQAQVTVGEASKTAKINVTVEANVAPDDPAQNQTWGPFTIELRKGGESQKSRNISVEYDASGCRLSQERGESCGGSVTASEEFSFNNVEQGNYTVCLGDRCAEVRKVEGVAASVTLAVNQDDINNAIGPEEETTSCAIDNIGWLVCPVLNFMAGIVDRAYSQVADWLKVTPLTTTTRGENGGVNTMYSAWGVMRNIANLAFVIGFMFIIYSQITSIGLSNYGIKKLLPKIIVAAILVNVSYWICSIAVDLSNILGSSLYKLFDAEMFSQGISTDQFAGDISSTGNGWTAIVAFLLASAAIWAALPALIVALPAALFAIVTVFLVLALRQVLIILLVVISPLAFVALLLPNTEDYFKKWRSLFQTLLLLYPIIAAIFGASAMASTIVMNSATDINGDGKIAVQLMAALITVLPLAITPLVLKFSGGLLSRFGGMINNPNKGPFDKMRKRTDALAGRMRNRRTANSINRGQQFGKKVRSSQIGMRGAATSAYLQDRIKGDNDSKVRGWLAERYGKVSSRASNGIEYAASMGATGKVDAAERDKYAKIGADSAARNYVAERAVDSKAYATSLAGGDAGVATLVQAYGKQAVHEEDVKDVKAQRVLINGATIPDLMARAQDTERSASERAAAVQEIAERGGHQHVQAMYDYLMREGAVEGKDIHAVQELSAEALLRRKPAGVGATTANGLRSGTMKGKVDDSGNVYGVLEEFAQRIEGGKFDAKGLAGMDVDDHIRLAELAANNRLSDESLIQIRGQLQEIRESDTMSLTPEQQRILEGALSRQAATYPDGKPYKPNFVELTPPKPRTPPSP